ncbi:unnamed protein product, partial [Aphanomyces euteiches]
LDHLKATAEKGPGLMTINPGRKVETPDVEAEVLEFYEELRNDDLAVSTKMLVLKAMSIDRTFHNGDRKKLNWWVKIFSRETIFQSVVLLDKDRKSQVISKLSKMIL